MDLREFRVVVRIVDRLAKRALFAEKQMVALEGQCAEWRRIADELKAELNLTTVTAESVIKERDALSAQLDTERERHKQTASILAQYAPKPVDVPRAHPVKAGEYLRRLTGFNTTPAGEIAQVIRVHVGAESNSYEYEILRPNGQPGAWVSKNCTPCDPPPEASHDTPEGKQTAEGAVEPKPGDVVRLEEDK